MFTFAIRYHPSVCHLYICNVRAAYCSVLFCSCGQRSNPLWNHALRPFLSRLNVLAQQGRSLVNNVCECMGEEGLSRHEQLCQVLIMHPF